MNKFAAVLAVVIGLFFWFKDPSGSVTVGDIDVEYIVKYPADGGSSERLPLLIALHGNGDTPAHFFDTALDQLQAKARVVLLKAPDRYWPMDAAGLLRYGEAVKQAVDEITDQFPTLGKPLLLGFSGGGVMAYYQAAVFRDTYSAIFPISGRLSENELPAERSSSSRGAKVYAFHGKKDSVVGFSGGQAAADLLSAQGVAVRFTEFDGGHHGIFTDMKTTISQLVDKKINAIL